MKQAFRLYVDGKIPNAEAISRFLLLCKPMRSELICRMIAHYLGEEGVSFYRNCDENSQSDVYASSIYLQLLMQKLQTSEDGDDASFNKLIPALNRLAAGADLSDAKASATFGENRQLPEGRKEGQQGAASDSLLDSEEPLSEADRENAISTMSFFNDGQ